MNAAVILAVIEWAAGGTFEFMNANCDNVSGARSKENVLMGLILYNKSSPAGLENSPCVWCTMLPLNECTTFSSLSHVAIS